MEYRPPAAPAPRCELASVVVPVVDAACLRFLFVPPSEPACDLMQGATGAGAAAAYSRSVRGDLADVPLFPPSRTAFGRAQGLPPPLQPDGRRGWYHHSLCDRVREHGLWVDLPAEEAGILEVEPVLVGRL
jgi:hypothetical protein